MLDLLLTLLLADNSSKPKYEPNASHNTATEKKYTTSGTRGCEYPLPNVSLWLPSMRIQSTPSDIQYLIVVSVIDLDTNAQIFSWETRTSEEVQQIPVPSSLEGEKQAIVVGIRCPNDPYAGQFLETFINR